MIDQLTEVADIYRTEIMDAMEQQKRLPVTHEVRERRFRQAAMMVRNDWLRLLQSDQTGIVRFAFPGYPQPEAEIRLYNPRAVCSVHGDKGCEHTTAAYFALYQRFASLSEWLAEWRQSATQTAAPSRTAEKTPEAWREVFDQLTGTFPSIGDNVPFHMISSAVTLYRQQVREAEPLEQEWKPLFRLYSGLFGLRAVTAGAPAGGFSIGYDRWQYGRLLDQLTDGIRDELKLLSTSRRLFAADPFYHDLEELIRTLTLSAENAQGRWLSVYREMWESLFSGSDARQRELGTLRRMNEEGEKPPALRLMTAYLEVLSGVPATGLDAPLSENDLPLFPSYLDMASSLAENGHADEARNLLMSLVPQIGNYMESVSFLDQRTAAGRLADLCRETDVPDETAADILFRCGSAAEAEYAEFLLSRDHYREWAAYHHLNRSSLERIERTGLKTMIDEAPMEAIFLMNVHVEEQIAQKSRQNYREAVRILKKMKRAAKKAGRAEWWSGYVGALRRRHQRLRALMEELEKGGLLS
ncbi:hypothetical protein [Bhargavaea cecembensis]|nr:hypothetical protein [Bhargavaea cecembensis]